MSNRKSVLAAAILAACLLATAFPLAAQTTASQLATSAQQALGRLPASMPSAQNPITPAKVALGRVLYFEPRISVDGTVSCSRCHLVGLYATDGLPKAIGNNAKLNPRNAPTVLNAAAQIAEHWIGNRKSVEDQATQAPVGPPSFGMPSYEATVKTLKAIPGYGPMFSAAFPGEADPVTADNFGLAVGAFERTLVTPAPFDAFLGGDTAALGAQQQRGLAAFMGRGCSSCHSSAFVGGQMYMKFGLTVPYWQLTGSKEIDEGRFAVTGNPADKYFFKVPVLRNVAMTPLYFHDGSVPLLSDAVRIMGKAQLGADLAAGEIGDIDAFLVTLTGQMPDAPLAAPVLPSTQGF